MKKVFTIIIATAFIVAEPLMAMDAQASIPKELSDIGVTAEDLKDVGPAIEDTPTSAEADIMRHRWRGRFCPRGYRLVVYRIRIGRFIVTRYRCVRFRRGRGRWDDHRGGGRWDDGRGWDYSPNQQVQQPVSALPAN